MSRRANQPAAAPGANPGKRRAAKPEALTRVSATSVKDVPSAPPTTTPTDAASPVGGGSSEVDDLLASMADQAIDQLFARHAVPRPAPRTAVESETLVPQADTEADVELTPDEQAALADDVPEPPADDSRGPGGALITSMPTDEELDALLRAELERESPIAGRTSRRSEGRFDDRAATALAAELDADVAARLTAPPTIDPLPVADRLGGSFSFTDADAIEADGAIEARIGVNVVEPPAVAPDDAAAVALSAAHVAPVVVPSMAPATSGPDAEAVVTAADSAHANQGKPDTQPTRRSASWWLKPLVWLNAPLAIAPHPVRDVVGKIALVTILNATAVLVYVLVIRR